MTTEEAIEQLSVLGDEPEGHHIGADGILLEFLRSNGYEKIAEAYEAVDQRAGGFWYA